MATTNLIDGVTNVPETVSLGSYLAPDPTLCHVWFDDFDAYVSGNWTVTETQAGATQAIVDGDGGIIALTNSAADDDVNQIQWAKETFRLVVGKQTWMKVRFKVSDATQSDVLIGLWITDTSPVASKPSDGFFFSKLDGSTSMTLQVGKNTTYSSGTVATIVADTYITVAAYYDGSTITYFANDVRVGSLAATNLCDDEDLAVGITVQNGEAAAKTLSVDYLMIAKER